MKILDFVLVFVIFKEEKKFNLRFQFFVANIRGFLLPAGQMMGIQRSPIMQIRIPINEFYVVFFNKIKKIKQTKEGGS